MAPCPWLASHPLEYGAIPKTPIWLNLVFSLQSTVPQMHFSECSPEEYEACSPPTRTSDDLPQHQGIANLILEFINPVFFASFFFSTT